MNRICYDIFKVMERLDRFSKEDKRSMRARTRKSEPISFEKLKDFLTTVLLHLSFYAFIVFIVIFFIDNFS